MSYRSAIFYTSDEQKRVAEDTIADVEASGLWPGKVVTEVTPAGPFWEAEPEHQDYLERIPNGYTCHFVRRNWVLPKREAAERQPSLTTQVELISNVWPPWLRDRLSRCIEPGLKILLDVIRTS
jgi:hypothetical protein